MRLADTPCDQLRVLRTEVDDEDRIASGVHRYSLGSACYRPMPTPCARWSALPSVCSDGATITSAFWNSLSVS